MICSCVIMPELYPPVYHPLLFTLGTHTLSHNNGSVLSEHCSSLVHGALGIVCVCESVALALAMPHRIMSLTPVTAVQSPKSKGVLASLLLLQL